jgi:hypothetical protein
LAAKVEEKKTSEKVDTKQFAAKLLCQTPGPVSALESKAKLVITRHRALYSNTSELKEFITCNIKNVGKKRPKTIDNSNLLSVSTSEELIMALHHLLSSCTNLSIETGEPSRKAQ